MNKSKQARGAGLGCAAWLGGIMTMSMAGCASPDAITTPGGLYGAALQATDTGGKPALAAGSEAERKAIGNMVALFEDFSETNVSAHVREVYDENAYLRDGFKELQGIDPIAEYMIESTKPLRACSFEFVDTVSQGGEVYLRWIMTLNLKRDNPERVGKTIGMTHVRFDAEGKVVFQQDYWDPTDVLYSRIPVANWMIKQVKKRL